MKKLIRNLLYVICSYFFSLNGQIKIEPTFFGQNYWWTNNRNSMNSNDFTSTNWNYVTASGVRLIRVGGQAYNSHENPQTPGNLASPEYIAEYVKIVDNIRAKNCEPVITIPFEYHPNWSLQTTNPISFDQALKQARDKAKWLIHVLNDVHKRGVKYVIIANEPEIDYGWNDFSDIPHIAKYVKSISASIKQTDPDVLIIGPELIMLNPSWYDGYTGAN